MSTLTVEELDSIIRALQVRYGLDFSNYEPVSLSRRVNRIIAKYELENALGLWRKIIYDPAFIQCFVDETTVGLTEMFRNHDFWIKIRTDIIPAHKHKPDFAVWHAGCSTGEEAYSMAIVLEEEHPPVPASLVATDINTAFLRSAEQARFSSIYQKTYAANYAAAKGKKSLEAYYQLKGDEMVFDRSRHAIRFHQHNLVKDQMSATFDLILCRNVMIYFDDILKKRVLKLFYDCLPVGGYLAVGYYDTMPADCKDMFQVYDASCKIYRKI
jgi:chemotaxis protein methyltransferase CheR